MDKDINNSSIETIGDHCKWVEDFLEKSNHKSFEFTSIFTSKKGDIYDVHVSYIRRERN